MYLFGFHKTVINVVKFLDPLLLLHLTFSFKNVYSLHVHFKQLNISLCANESTKDMTSGFSNFLILNLLLCS